MWSLYDMETVLRMQAGAIAIIQESQWKGEKCKILAVF
jgi:hypothetical protein